MWCFTPSQPLRLCQCDNQAGRITRLTRLGTGIPKTESIHHLSTIVFLLSTLTNTVHLKEAELSGLHLFISVPVLRSWKMGHCLNIVSIYHFVICVDSKSFLCALKSWNCKMRGDIFYEVFNTLYHVQGYWD